MGKQQASPDSAVDVGELVEAITNRRREPDDKYNMGFNAGLDAAAAVVTARLAAPEQFAENAKTSVGELVERLRGALKAIEGCVVDGRDIFPSSKEQIEAIGELAANALGGNPAGEEQIIERAGARMMHGEIGRRLTSAFTDEEIRSLARAALSHGEKG